MEKEIGETLVDKATRTFELLREIEGALGKIEDFRRELEELRKGLPVAQTSVHGSAGMYVYSDGRPESARTIATTERFETGQKDGQSFVRIGLWCANGEYSNFITRYLTEASGDSNGVMPRDMFVKLADLPSAEQLAEQAQTIVERIEEVEQQIYRYHVRPALRERLLKIGYTEDAADAVIAAYPELTEAEVELREGLAAINYTPTECEECVEDVPKLTMADIDYAKEILAAWDPETTDMTRTFENDERLVVMPKIDTGAVTNMVSTWNGCVNLAYFPQLDVTQVRTAHRLFVDYGDNWGNDAKSVKIKRLPSLNFVSIVNLTQAFASMLKCEKSGRITMGPNCTALVGLFQACTALQELGGIECEDWSKITSIRQMFQNSPISDMPFTDLHNITACSAAFSMAHNLGDSLKDVTLTSTSTKRVDLSSFFAWSFGGPRPLSALPQLDIPMAGDMSLFCSSVDVKVIPDYSHLSPTNLDYFYAAQERSIAERFEGLNFAEVTSAKGVFAYYNTKNLNKKLRYIRIINLGKSACTSYPLRGAERWGEGSAENLQSLVDSLLTNSYDRVAAGMPAATLQLDTETAARLTQEQLAAITAKGFTITTH